MTSPVSSSNSDSFGKSHFVTEKHGDTKKTDPNIENERKANMEEKIRSRVACEERAFRIVQKLVENTVSGDYLKDVAAYIDQSHYADIVEERSIALLCGYPVCDKQLTKVPKQKYKICTKTNQVLDITDSKRFCGPRCYKFSQYYMNQVPTSPVWTRRDQPNPQIQLLGNQDKVSHVQGEVILQDPRVSMKAELKELERSDHSDGTQHNNDNMEEKSTRLAETELPDIFPTEQSTAESLVNTPQADPAVDTQEDMALRSHGLDQKQQAVTSALHKDIMTRSFTGQKSDHLDQPYCQRDPDQQSQGYVNRATYYGYDQKQQALKAALNKQIVNTVLRGKFNQTEPFNTGIGSNQDSLTGPYGLGQKSQAVKTSVNKSIVTDNLHKHHNCSNPSADIKPDLSNPFHVKTDTSDIKSLNQTHHNKAERLMDLLDKRDSLKQKLKSCKDSNNQTHTSEKHLSDKVNTKPSNTLSKSNNDNVDNNAAKSTESKALPMSATSCQSSRVLENSDNSDNNAFDPKSTESRALPMSAVSSRSSRVLENITRASSQQQGVVDSDDELDEDDEQSQNSTNITSQMKSLSLTECTAVTTANKTPSAQNERMAVTTASVTPLALIRRILMEWITPETRTYLKGVLAAQSGDEKTQKKHAALNRKVEAQIRQYAHLLDGEDQNANPSKPVPSISDLMTDPYTMKVHEFYSQGPNLGKKPPKDGGQNQTYLVEPIEQTQGGRKKKLFDHEVETSNYDRDEFITDKVIRLPYIDSQSQISLRRKIVMDKLTTVLGDLLGAVRLSIRDISAELRTTVNTFNLTSENIVLKPAEWSLMRYCVLRLLSLKVKPIKKSLRQDQSGKVFTAVLQSFGVTRREVKDMIQEILS